jgi:hypothetical protein
MYKRGIAVKPDTRRIAYVYAIEVNGVVRYIGKGTGDRMYFHRAEAERTLRRIKKYGRLRLRRWQRHLVAALRKGEKVQEIVIRSGLSDLAAYRLENELIGEYHLLRTGQLWNTIDERFIDPRYLPAEWNDPENPLYRLPRPLGRNPSSCRSAG